MEPTRRDRSADPDATRGGWFSPKAFALALLLSLVGAGLGGSVPLVGFVGRFVGLFLAAFVVGVVASHRRYVETGLAGALLVGGSFALSLLSIGVLPVGYHYLQRFGPAWALAGAGLGLVVSLVGHYFGRDLRAGFTREL